jgi:hypothetical protein
MEFMQQSVGRAQDVPDMRPPVGQRRAYARPMVWIPQESSKSQKYDDKSLKII